jgi:hypothetical protein
MFIQKSDYKQRIKQNLLSELVEGDYSLLESAEVIAETTVKNYFRNKYDLDKIFLAIPEYSSGTTYNNDDYVWMGSAFTESVYKKIEDTWIKEDPRDLKIVQVILDIVIFSLSTRLSPKNIPDVYSYNYDKGIEYLKMLSRGQLNPNLEKPLNGKNNFKPMFSVSGATASAKENWSF